MLIIRFLASYLSCLYFYKTNKFVNMSILGSQNWSGLNHLKKYLLFAF